jgi:hypothetical protein
MQHIAATDGILKSNKQMPRNVSPKNDQSQRRNCKINLLPDIVYRRMRQTGQTSRNEKMHLPFSSSEPEEVD